MWKDMEFLGFELLWHLQARLEVPKQVPKSLALHLLPPFVHQCQVLLHLATYRVLCFAFGIASLM